MLLGGLQILPSTLSGHLARFMILNSYLVHMVRIEWLRPDKSVGSSDVYLGIEWEEDDLVENEEPVAWQRLAETFDDHSEVKVIINNNALHCNVLSTIPAEVVTLTNLKGGGKVKKAIGSGSCYS